MKKFKRIRREIRKARLRWIGIQCESKEHCASDLNDLYYEMEELKNHIEKARMMVADRLFKCNKKILREYCVDLLTEIFDLSKNLQNTYAFAVYYDEPSNVFDMIQRAKR